MESPTTPDPTLEEQAAEFDKAEASGTEEAQAAEQASIAEANGDNPDRPEWLPEKFANAEEMAKAYSELEGKQGTQEPVKEEGLALGEETNDEEQKAAEEGAPAQQEVINKAAEQFRSDGELNDDSYKALEKQGISKELADQFAAGQAAQTELQQLQSTQVQNEVYESVGGEDSYKNMAAWAKQNLPTEEQNSYDRLVNSGNKGDIKLAVAGLYSKYTNSVGEQPANTLQGMKAKSSVLPFNNSAEMVDAMSNPKYRTDTAYRKQVENRLAMTNL